MDIDGDSEDTSRRIQVRFITKLKAPFKVPANAIAIPSNLTRLGLSTVVNNLLSAGNPEWEEEPFDFLINGELVRMSLEKFLLVKGISAEKTLEIEYFKAVAPRREEEPSVHDDWVSAVDGSCPGFILTGSYDGLGRVWESAGLCTHILEGHTDAVSSVCIVNPEEATNVTLATASKDRTLRLWKYSKDDRVSNPTKIRPFKVLKGHRLSVQSVASQKSGNLICSGSWDYTIKLWRTDEHHSEGNVSIKKRKKNDQAEESQLEEDSVATLVGHSQSVSSVAWPKHEEIYSVSWDHSVRRWDVETGNVLFHHLCGKALNCLDIGGEGSSLIAAGGSDPTIRIWDPRKPGTSSPIFQLSSHTSWVSACKWHDKSWFHLLSASYDGKVMLWDLRAVWPLAVVDSHKDKVLSADWWKDDTVVSGGADSKLRISSGIYVS